MLRVVSRSALAVVVAALVCALGAGVASAHLLYVSPNGDDPSCSFSRPCSLQVAAGRLSAGDTVSVAPGSYDHPYFIGAPSVTIMGGANMTADPQHKPILLDGLQLSGDGDVVTDLDIRGMLDVRAPATIERAIVTDDGTHAYACHLASSNVTLRDSFCTSLGSGTGDAVYGVGANIVLRNVTASGTKCAVEASGGTFGAPTTSVSLVNTIARPTWATGTTDADVCVTNLSHPVKVTAQSSNYGSVDESDAPTVLFTSKNDVSGSPLFVAPDPLSGLPDLHEAAGSPTIGAGLSDPANGAMDVDGDPRASACTGKTDVGADQVACP